MIIAADQEVGFDRFARKKIISVGVVEGIRHPEVLIERVQSAPVRGGGGSTPAGSAIDGGGGGRERSVTYKALMNLRRPGVDQRASLAAALRRPRGVSYMIPFVVVGGLLAVVHGKRPCTSEMQGPSP